MKLLIMQFNVHLAMNNNITRCIVFKYLVYAYDLCWCPLLQSWHYITWLSSSFLVCFVSIPIRFPYGVVALFRASLCDVPALVISMFLPFIHLRVLARRFLVRQVAIQQQNASLNNHK
jgi:glycopeptide antibiotics resistance protein